MSNSATQDEKYMLASNPIGRLLNLFQKLQNIQAKKNEKMFDAFGIVLDVSPENPAKLLKRIGGVFQLLESAERVIKEQKEVDIPLYLEPIKKLRQPFQNMNFDASMATYTGHFTSEVILGLKLVNDYLKRNYSEPTISEQGLKDILKSIDTFWQDVDENDGIPEELRLFIVERLDSLREAVEMYPITGAKPVMQSADSIIGGTLSIAVQYNLQSEDNKNNNVKDICKKMITLGSKAYSVIQFVNALKELPAAVKGLMGMLPFIS